MTVLHPPCACGKPSTWVYEPNEDKVACDDCVPRGCACTSTELYDAQMRAYEQDELPLVPPDFDPEKDARRDADGKILPCCEWWRHDDMAQREANLAQALLQEQGTQP